MLRHVGAALGLAPAIADRQPVRRHSYLAGRCEGVFWSRTDKREVRRIVLAARKYDLAGRQPGRPNGPLGHVALEILELLGHVVDYRSGRLEPAIAYLMRKLRRSRDAVVRALANLRAHGFLDWLRRFERVERDGPRPRVKQITNAYRMRLPARAARLLAPAVPLPDDMEHEACRRLHDVAEMKADLSLDELALVEVEDDPLRKALAQMALMIQKRESAPRTEPKANSFI